MSDTEIIVCTTCRPSGASRERPAEGLALFEAVQEALLVCELDAGQHKGLRVRGQACMSGCSRACTVTLQAQGKFTYYFGDLFPDAETAAWQFFGMCQQPTLIGGLLSARPAPDAERVRMLAETAVATFLAAYATKW